MEDEINLHEINALGEKISAILKESGNSPTTCIFVLLNILVVSTYRMNIPKPYLLNMISETWEGVDENQTRNQNEEKCEDQSK